MEAKEEILKKHHVPIDQLNRMLLADGPDKGSVGERISKAMEDYASQQCAIKDERIRKLETQLESAQAMMDTLVSRQQLKEKDDRIKELEATIEYAKWKPGKLPGRL